MEHNVLGRCCETLPLTRTDQVEFIKVGSSLLPTNNTFVEDCARDCILKTVQVETLRVDLHLCLPINYAEEALNAKTCASFLDLCHLGSVENRVGLLATKVKSITVDDSPLRVASIGFFEVVQGSKDVTFKLF